MDRLELPNYNDVEMRLAEPEMTATKQRSYLQKVINDAEKKRQRITPIKSNATLQYKAGKISIEQIKLIHEKC